MRPDNMPRPFAPEHSAKPSHIEVLNEMLGEAHVERIISPETEPRYAALTAAIAALEAIGNAVAVYQFECDGNWVDCTKEHFEEHDGSEKRILYTQVAEENKKLRDQRDFLVEEYERAVGCGPQCFVHCAGHLFNAITNAKIESKIVKQEAVEDKRIADAVRGGRVIVEAVATIAKNNEGTYLDWLLEGGISGLEEGEVLLVCQTPLTNDAGVGEVIPASVLEGE